MRASAQAGAALTLGNDAFLALVAERIAGELTPERIEALAEKKIAERIGLLTLEQAARHLQCKNVRQLVDFCREHKIPVEHFGKKKRFIKLAEIERALERRKLATFPGTSSTRIARVSDPAAGQMERSAA